MNKKGQTLVLFIIFIPILLLLAAFIIDTGIIIRESTKLKAVTKTVLKDTYYKEGKNSDMILSLLKKNDIDISNAKVTISEENVIVKNSYKVASIFGKIVGIKEYNISVSLKAVEQNGKLKIIKE